MKRSFLAFGLALLLVGRLAAQPPPFLQGAGITQRLGATVPHDLAFRDEHNQPVRLGSYLNDRPVILILAYYRCPMLCNLVLNSVVESLKKIKLEPGRDFEILTVSFDAREKPDLAAAKKKSYVEEYNRTGAEAGWHFLTGDAANIAKLARAVGFQFRYDPQTDQFAHSSGIMVLTPSGQVSRYLLGVKYMPTDLRLALVESARENIGSPVDQVLLYCYGYDPNAGRYTPYVMRILRLLAAATVLTLAGGIAYLLRLERRRRSAAPAAGEANRDGSNALAIGS